MDVHVRETQTLTNRRVSEEVASSFDTTFAHSQLSSSLFQGGCTIDQI